ncbi:hypothetical protein DAI22_11g204050 [Oryza sativa Japonica Group]|nr:hypothetical protein DAI22_11g204050 [Oryza sativa Japonica Group]
MSCASLLSAAIRRGVAGCRASPPSASAIVSRPATGSHILRIDGYTNTKSILATGESATSRRFAVGGHSFVMRYYPNGLDDGCADSISLFVDVAGGGGCGRSGIAGHARFSVLDHAGSPARRTDDASSEVVDFRTHFSGQRSLITRDELERSPDILRDDRFAVRCDLTVMDEHLLTVDLDHH